VIDPREFDTFYLGARQRVLRCVFLLSGDLGEAQDATQEAFVRAWQRWDRIRSYADPESWVRTVACRIAVGRWRGLMRRAAALRLLKAGSARVAHGPSEERLDIVTALRALPAGQRVAIVLHYFAGMPIAEIALQTDVAEGTVKARLSRGRKALAELLDSDAHREETSNV